jgi:hypothetical protein
MNQHLLVKMPERRTDQIGTPHRCLAGRDAAMRRSDEGREQDAISFPNPGKAQNTRFSHGAQPISKANALAGAIALGLACDWRLDLDRSGAPGPALRLFPAQLNDSELIRGSSGDLFQGSEIVKQYNC